MRIQTNSVKSWLALRPTPEIILVGNEDGVSEMCARFGLLHAPKVATTPSGRPIISDVFAQAEARTINELMCYVNADIMLTQTLIEAVVRLRQRFARPVLVCAPVNCTVPFGIQADGPGWESAYTFATSWARPRAGGADVFVFPRAFYRNIPPVPIG